MNNQEILATVAGENITKAELDAFLQGLPKEQRAYAQNVQFRDQYLQQLIALRLYSKMGEDMKLDETEEYKHIMESARKDVLAQMAMTETLKGLEVTPEEAMAYYEEHPQHFTKGATVSAKHILT